MIKVVAVVDGKFIWRCDKCGEDFARTKEQSQYLPSHECKARFSQSRRVSGALHSGPEHGEKKRLSARSAAEVSYSPDLGEVREATQPKIPIVGTK